MEEKWFLDATKKKKKNNNNTSTKNQNKLFASFGVENTTQ